MRTFLNDSFYDRGLITREVTLDANGHKFIETINQYDFTTVVGGSPRGYPRLEEFTATRFPHLTRSDQRFYEGNPNGTGYHYR